MGLDQYLTRKLYIKQWDHQPLEEQFHFTLTRAGKPITLTRPSYIEDEVGCWRKANQIHEWFVENVQDGEDDCKEYHVEVEQLITLRDLCNEVIERPELGPELLPTASGFFFGSTEYGEWYLNDLKDTVVILDKVIQENEEHRKERLFFDYYYRASW